MFVTEVLDGRPYQSYIPVPMVPVIAQRYLSDFASLDQRMRDSVDESAFNAAIIASLAQDNGRSLLEGGADRAAGLSSAVTRAFSLNRIRSKDLIEINSRVVQKPRTGFRKAQVWMGAPHPAMAWHVGSPPAKLTVLVNQILAMAQLSWPVSLIALVSLIRLLQVHPFPDGNGRTARLYAAWLLHSRLGPSPLIAVLFSALWARSLFSINAASTAIRDYDGWPIFFDYCLRSVQGNAPSTYDGQWFKANSSAPKLQEALHEHLS